MTAIVYDGTEVTVVESESQATGSSHEAVIRTRLGGICATDLEITRGYFDYTGVLGHEFVGDVVDCSDASLVGQRVVGNINCACLGCDYCSKNEYSHCRNRTVLGIAGRSGVFQDTFSLPMRNLYRVPESVSDEIAVFAEPLAAACRIVEQLDVESWKKVAVLGDGKLGLLCALVMADAFDSVTVVGHHPGRMRYPVTVQETAPGDAPKESFDIVVDATGSEAGLAEAMHLVRPLGTIVLKTTCAPKHTLSLAPLVVNEVTVIGSRCGPMDTALELLASGRIPVQNLISDRLPMADGVEAFERASQPGVLKVLLEGIQ